MTAIGLIINARSDRNTMAIDDLLYSARRFGSVHAEVLDGVHGLGKALAGMNRNNVDTLILAGGDGTVQATFTDIINRRRFEHSPYVVALPCGMTNVVANDCGLKGAPADCLDNFLWRRQKGEVAVLRRSLTSVAAGGKEPVYGFFFGAGAFHSAVQFSRSTIQSKGARRSVALIVSILGYVFKVVFDPENTLEPLEIEFIDNDAEKSFLEAPKSVFITTTLNKLGSGIFPFWGRGEGAMAATMVDYPPRRLLRAAPTILRGKSKPWFEEYGYHSWRTDRMVMRFDGPFVFDGEIFHSHRNEELIFGAAHSADFLQ